MSTTLERAENAVTQLSTEELTKFRLWFAEYDGEHWDAQIVSDVDSGKLDALIAEAQAEYHAGRSTEI